ncbi:MAG: hypothetical protein IKF72_09375 [Kiritimatiellae bacterium]|nr:hypothetical protein [Kiritimatiellia bacterium]
MRRKVGNAVWITTAVVNHLRPDSMPDFRSAFPSPTAMAKNLPIALAKMLSKYCTKAISPPTTPMSP